MMQWLYETGLYLPLAFVVGGLFMGGLLACIYHLSEPPRGRRVEPDLTQVAIDRLYSLGTEGGSSLAAEIERGRARRETDV